MERAAERIIQFEAKLTELHRFLDWNGATLRNSAARLTEIIALETADIDRGYSIF